MSNVFKYRVGNKWYSFDKSILEPEDLRVFELADWTDKLKIITIYQDLKPKEDDTVVILKTKTEKATKDKRAAEYRKKKTELEQKLREATEKAPSSEEPTQEQANLIKQLNNLDVEYADVVNIQTAETVNIAKTNQVILNDVNELINKTNNTLNELRPSLKSVDFNTINENVKNLIEAKSNTQLTEIINAIENKLNDLATNTLSPEVQKGVETMTDAIEKLKETAIELKESEIVDKLIELGLLGNKDVNKLTYLKTCSLILSKLEKSKISDDDLLLLSKYPKAVVALKQIFKTDAIKYVKAICDLIRFYVEWFNLKADSDISNIGIDNYTYKTEKEVKGKFKFADITKKTDFENFLNRVKISNAGNKYDLFIKYEGKDFKHYIGTYEFDINDKSQTGTYKIIKTIVDNEQVEEDDKPAAVETVEGQGFLGLKTKKEAKKDFDFINERINKILAQQDKILEKLDKVLNSQNLKVEETNTDTTQEASYVQPVIKSSYLQDIREQPKLKHIEPMKKAPELTDLQKAFIKRREEMGYTDDDITDDNDEVWADGLKLPNFGLRGGLLGELQKDLNKYGLVLSLSPDKNAYFVNVFNRKPKGSGIEEADAIVKSVDKNTEYKDLKKLYEQLY